MSEDLAVFDNIIYYLENEGLEYDLLEHDFVHSSEEAAKVRGTNLEEAAKALVLKAKITTPTAATKTNVDNVNLVGAGETGDDPSGVSSKDRYFMCIVSGDKKLDLKKVKKVVGSKNVSLANPEKVLELTGLEVGKIPPFPFLFDLDGYVDKGVLENKYVCFSAASNYKSIRMKSAEWRVIASVPDKDIAKE